MLKKILILIVLCLISSESYSQWVKTNAPTNGTIFSFSTDGKTLLASCNVNGILRLSDELNWEIIDTGATKKITGAAAVRDDIFLSGSKGVFISTDKGISWDSISNGITDFLVTSLAIKDSIFFAGTAGGGIFRSTNFGLTWIQANIGLSGVYPYVTFYNLVVSKDNIVAGAWAPGYQNGGAYVSTNNGQSWSWTNLSVRVLALCSDDNRIFAANDYDIYYSLDNGLSWELISHFTFPNAIAVYKNNIFVSKLGAGGGVFVSDIGGTEWRDINTGLSTLFPESLGILDSNLYTGTSGDGIWKRPLSQITDVLHPIEKPLEYTLSQNYPNPFNPATTISFSLHKPEKVELKVFDMLGNEVAVLLSEYKSAGDHKVRFNGSNLSSGIYFYKLQAGDYSSVKKMVLMK